MRPPRSSTRRRPGPRSRDRSRGAIAQSRCGARRAEQGRRRALAWSVLEPRWQCARARPHAGDRHRARRSRPASRGRRTSWFCGLPTRVAISATRRSRRATGDVAATAGRANHRRLRAHLGEFRLGRQVLAEHAQLPRGPLHVGSRAAVRRSPREYDDLTIEASQSPGSAQLAS